MKLRVKELRKRDNLTQQKVADLLQIQKQTYQNYELAKRQPDIDMLIKLADFYHSSIDYIVGRETEMINVGVLDAERLHLVLDIINAGQTEVKKMRDYWENIKQK